MNGAQRLIVSHLTHPYLRPHVQPCTAKGKSLSEGHRLGAQLASDARFCTTDPVTWGICVEVPSAGAVQQITCRKLLRGLPISSWPSAPVEADLGHEDDVCILDEKHFFHSFFSMMSWWEQTRIKE